MPRGDARDQHLRAILRQLPTSPGVYLMKGPGGRVLYVGKADSLRNRVRSYFGSKAGLEFRANTTTVGYPYVSAVAGLAGGGFVVTWQSIVGLRFGVNGQRYAADGTPAGPEFRANASTAGYQQYSAVAGLTGGGFVVTWQSYGLDGSYSGVFGQRYAVSASNASPLLHAPVPDATETLGPIPVDEQTVRAILRVPHGHGPELSRALKQMQADRSARKLPHLRVQVDPVALG